MKTLRIIKQLIDIIKKIEFPDLLPAEFFYCFITNKEGERYEISLGV